MPTDQPTLRPTVRCGNCHEPYGDDNYCRCTRPNWGRKCENCGQTPIVPATGLCGPCTFGEAETANGNW